MKAKTLRLSDEMWEWLRREAFEQRVTQQSIIEDALTIYRERTVGLTEASAR